ncbi:MAG: hypothetical protein KBC38_03985 [Candidatus Pacebacteria bacterium]|nr:hypothetical protein [Candidatus Paceibacterota bacterium]MBP9840371.1 hypothetical protein [Candidatus Paceibacterota bacterium]
MKVREVPPGMHFASAEYVTPEGKSIPLYKSHDGRYYEVWFGDSMTYHYLTPVSPPELANAIILNLHLFGHDSNPELACKDRAR